jgi:hypothetical protein
MSEHSCQFFDSDDSRAAAVSAFIAQGLRRGDQLLVVARPVHWAAIVERLDSLRVPVSRELASGRVLVKDAMDALRRLTCGGALTAERFEQVIGSTVRSLSGDRPLRVYGEIVDILAQRGEHRAALELEELWNGLAAAVPFTLMCGYSAPHFVSPSTHAGLRAICAAHTDVRRHDQDALANWLLTAAHNPIGASSSH